MVAAAVASSLAAIASAVFAWRLFEVSKRLAEVEIWRHKQTNDDLVRTELATLKIKLAHANEWVRVDEIEKAEAAGIDALKALMERMTMESRQEQARIAAHNARLQRDGQAPAPPQRP